MFSGDAATGHPPGTQRRPDGAQRNRRPAMIVEPAALEDARAVAQIHVAAWRCAYADIVPADYLAALSVDRREAMWKEAVASGQSDVLVAREGGVMLGWISFGACRDDDAPAGQAEVWAIYVDPRHWSRGVGRALWQRARDRMRAQGYSACSLWVFPGNAQAIRFYRAAGFAPDGTPPQPFELGGRQMSEVRYLCRIDGPPFVPAAT